MLASARRRAPAVYVIASADGASSEPGRNLPFYGTTAPAGLVTRCTGIAATWCPVHGDCTCPRADDDGGPVVEDIAGLVSLGGGLRGWSESAASKVVHDPICPLHADTSTHAET